MPCLSLHASLQQSPKHATIVLWNSSNATQAAAYACCSMIRQSLQLDEQHVCHTVSMVVKPTFQIFICFASILDVQVRLLWISKTALGYVQKVHSSAFTADLGRVVCPLLS